MHAAGCAATETARLLVLDRQGEPPGHPQHMIAYDHIVVEVCDSCNGATVEKLHHDCFDFEEVWDQYEWYELSPTDGARMRIIASQCPRPLDPDCSCPIHRSLLESTQSLPASGWQAVFEWSRHHQPIALAEGPPPRFVPDEALRGAMDLALAAGRTPAAPASAAEQQRLTKGEWRWLARVMVVLFVFALVAYFRFVHWPWFVDMIVVLAMAPASVLGAVTLTAFFRAIHGTRERAPSI